MPMFPGDVWGGAWGHTWAGSWGLTYEAAQDNLWDTSQGIARNLANNLKWRPIYDAETSLGSFGLRFGSGDFAAYGSVNIALPHVGAYLGAGIWRINAEANGFAELRGFGCKGGGTLSASGNGFVLLSAHEPVVFGWNNATASGDAIVLSKGGKLQFSDVCRIRAAGVINPDEVQLLSAVLPLFTRKQEYVIVNSRLKGVI